MRVTRSLCSPLRRGWSPLAWHPYHRAFVLPAQAGVVPGHPVGGRYLRRAPRSGGGGPTSVSVPVTDQTCSPLRRGWSQGWHQAPCRALVLPAQAGVVPCPKARSCRGSCAPRSGGGGPKTVTITGATQLCSPLRRGWSHPRSQSPQQPHVLPAQAGVVPNQDATIEALGSAPRSGGGGPWCP